MSSSSHKRAWETPVATVLSIRSTANLVGFGGDTFMKGDNLGRNAVTPTAPLADVGARPIPAPSDARATGAEERTWDAPVVTTLTI